MQKKAEKNFQIAKMYMEKKVENNISKEDAKKAGGVLGNTYLANKVPVDSAKVANVVETRPVAHAHPKVTTRRGFGAARDQILHKCVERLNVIVREFRSHISVFQIFFHLH